MVEILARGPRFNENYRDYVRAAWLRTGKKSAANLYTIIDPDEEGGRKPTIETLKHWIVEDFRPYAEELDKQVTDKMNDLYVLEKVEMMKRHAETGKEMQNIALDWLRTHKDEINAIAAARILISGIDIERASKGIPQALQKMMQMKDEDIMKRIEDIVSRSPTVIEANVEEDSSENA